MVSCFMTTQVARIELPKIDCSYPEILQTPMQFIQQEFPELLRVIQGTLGVSFKIFLNVDLTAQEGPDLAQELEEKGICPEGLKGKKDISLETLESAGIISSPFKGAAWDFKKKAIHLSYAEFGGHQPKMWNALQVKDLLFEMQNACFTPLFEELYETENPLPIEQYVRRVEEIEFKSTALTYHRMDRLKFGRINVYRLTYLESFELHYLYQQTWGHADNIAEKYRKHFKADVVFQGTWQPPLRSHTQKRQLTEVLTMHLKYLRGYTTLSDLEQEVDKSQTVLTHLKFFNSLAPLELKIPL